MRILSGDGRPDKFVIISYVCGTEILCVHLRVNGSLNSLQDKWFDSFKRNRTIAAREKYDDVKTAVYKEEPLEQVMQGHGAYIEEYEHMSGLEQPSNAKVRSMIDSIRSDATSSRKVAFDELLANHEHWATMQVYTKSWSSQALDVVTVRMFVETFVIPGSAALIAWIREVYNSIPKGNPLGNLLSSIWGQLIAALQRVFQDVTAFFTSTTGIATGFVAAVVIGLIYFYYVSLRDLITREQDHWLNTSHQIVKKYSELTVGSVLWNMLVLMSRWIGLTGLIEGLRKVLRSKEHAAGKGSKEDDREILSGLDRLAPFA